MGQKKAEDQWSGFVNELYTMKYSNDITSKVFGDISDEEIQLQIMQVLTSPWKNDMICQLNPLDQTIVTERIKYLQNFLEEKSISKPPVNINKLKEELIGMGFITEAVELALVEHSSMNSALEWLTSQTPEQLTIAISTHKISQSFGLPKNPSIIPANTTTTTIPSTSIINENYLNEIVSMGVAEEQARNALEITQNNLQKAIDLLFS